MINLQYLNSYEDRIQINCLLNVVAPVPFSLTCYALLANPWELKQFKYWNFVDSYTAPGGAHVHVHEVLVQPLHLVPGKTCQQNVEEPRAGSGQEP